MTKQQEIENLHIKLMEKEKRIEELEMIVFSAAMDLDYHSTKLFKLIGQPTE